MSGPGGSSTDHRFKELSGGGCIESFEVTFTIHLLFTGFECEKEIVGMAQADIGDTAPK